MSEAIATRQQIVQQILELPPDALGDLAIFVEFLRFKASKTRKDEPPFRPPKIKLGGLLEGYDFSPKVIAKARQEMWGNFPKDIEFDGPVKESIIDMKRYVTDTHSIIWHLSHDRRLSRRARRILDSADDMPDRIIAATTRALNVPLITVDRIIAASGLVEVIW